MLHICTVYITVKYRRRVLRKNGTNPRHLKAQMGISMFLDCSRNLYDFAVPPLNFYAEWFRTVFRSFNQNIDIQFCESFL